MIRNLMVTITVATACTILAATIILCSEPPPPVKCSSSQEEQSTNKKNRRYGSVVRMIANDIAKYPKKYFYEQEHFVPFIEDEADSNPTRSYPSNAEKAVISNVPKPPKSQFRSNPHRNSNYSPNSATSLNSMLENEMRKLEEAAKNSLGDPVLGEILRKKLDKVQNEYHSEEMKTKNRPEKMDGNILPRKLETSLSNASNIDKAESRNNSDEMKTKNRPENRDKRNNIQLQICESSNRNRLSDKNITGLGCKIPATNKSDSERFANQKKLASAAIEDESYDANSKIPKNRSFEKSDNYVKNQIKRNQSVILEDKTRADNKSPLKYPDKKSLNESKSAIDENCVPCRHSDTKDVIPHRKRVDNILKSVATKPHSKVEDSKSSADEVAPKIVKVLKILNDSSEKSSKESKENDSKSFEDLSKDAEFSEVMGNYFSNKNDMDKKRKMALPSPNTLSNKGKGISETYKSRRSVKKTESIDYLKRNYYGGKIPTRSVKLDNNKRNGTTLTGKDLIIRETIEQLLTTESFQENEAEELYLLADTHYLYWVKELSNRLTRIMLKGLNRRLCEAVLENEYFKMPEINIKFPDSSYSAKMDEFFKKYNRTVVGCMKLQYSDDKSYIGKVCAIKCPYQYDLYGNSREGSAIDSFYVEVSPNEKGFFILVYLEKSYHMTVKSYIMINDETWKKYFGDSEKKLKN